MGIAKIFEKYEGFAQHLQANGYAIKHGLVGELRDVGVPNYALKPIIELRNDLSGKSLEKFIRNYKQKII